MVGSDTNDVALAQPASVILQRCFFNIQIETENAFRCCVQIHSPLRNPGRGQDDQRFCANLLAEAEELICPEAEVV